jgi:hypothetical protein
VCWLSWLDGSVFIGATEGITQDTMTETINCPEVHGMCSAVSQMAKGERVAAETCSMLCTSVARQMHGC